MEQQIEVLRVEIAKLEMKPGDVLLVNFEHGMSDGARAHWAHVLEQLTTELEAHYLMYFGGVEFSVLSKEEVSG